MPAFVHRSNKATYDITITLGTTWRKQSPKVLLAIFSTIVIVILEVLAKGSKALRTNQTSHVPEFVWSSTGHVFILGERSITTDTVENRWKLGLNVCLL